MTASITPLGRALEALRAEETATSSNDGMATSSSKAAPPAQSQNAVLSLKRIKYALIGNASRKIELASRPDDLQRIIAFVRVEPSLILDETSHHAFLQATDIISALALPRQECLTALIHLQVHRILLESIKQLVETIQHNDASPTSIEALYQRLLHAIRALKSVYIATVTLVDPYGARAAMQDLVLSSAQAKTKALGLSIPTPSARSPVKAAIPTSIKRSSSSSDVPPEKEIQACARNMFLTDDADNLLQTLRLLCQGTQDTSAQPSVLQYTQQALLHLCDLLGTCVRTPAQRQALEASQMNTSKAKLDPETWDTFVLLSSALESAPVQLAEAIIRTMTALLKDQSPSRGVRLPSHIIGGDGHDQNARMAERLSDPSPSMRLAAAEWHVVVYKSYKAVNVQWDFGVAPVIAVLLSLLSDPSPGISARAGFVLAFLITGNQSFQETASNMEAFQRIKELLDRLEEPVLPYETAQAAADRSSQEQAAFLVISALCMDIEDLRRKVVETKVLRHIIENLKSPFPNVRCATAQCARSLSRSINIIKTALMDTDAASILVELLENRPEDRLTQLAILAVVCNVFIEFSPLKTVLLETDGLVERIVELTKVIQPRGMLSSARAASAQVGIDEDEESSERMMEVKALVRHHALTAIKNMTYWSSSALKQKTARCLTWEYAVALLRDPDLTVRTEMLNILRNIACNEASDIDLVVRGIGEARLFSLIEESLHTSRQDMLLHGLYLVSNIATGTETHRSAIMNRLGIIRAVYDQLKHASSDVRVAAVWATINLCHRSETGHRRFNEHAQRLRAMGFESRLKEMRDDPSMDVRERVRDALEGGFDPDPASHSMIID